MKIFIAGPRAIKDLHIDVCNRLHNIYTKNYTVIVGDASGVDTAVQKYFSQLNYTNVVVFASNGKARNNIGNWQVETISVPGNIRGFDFYVAKDKAMANNADYGFMIWNGKSKGTLNNIINLIHDNKKALIYFTPNNDFICIDSFDRLETLLGFCNDETKKLVEKIYHKPVKSSSQLSLFESSGDILCS